MGKKQMEVTIYAQICYTETVYAWDTDEAQDEAYEQFISKLPASYEMLGDPEIEVTGDGDD